MERTQLPLERFLAPIMSPLNQLSSLSRGVSILHSKLAKWSQRESVDWCSAVAIAQINQAGGVLGQHLEPLIVYCWWRFQPYRIWTPSQKPDPIRASCPCFWLLNLRHPLALLSSCLKSWMLCPVAAVNWFNEQFLVCTLRQQKGIF